MNLLFPKENKIYHLPNSILEYYPQFFDEEKANTFFSKLYAETPWQQDNITVFGKTHLQPRLTALFGNEGKPYTYSGIIMHPHKWNALLMFIKNEVETICQVNFTTVLLNLYRNGNDSMGYHADNEKELGKKPCHCIGKFWGRTNDTLSA
jgi:alkylated DNA repair dioxygenase AlkB